VGETLEKSQGRPFHLALRLQCAHAVPQPNRIRSFLIGDPATGLASTLRCEQSNGEPVFVGEWSASWRTMTEKTAAIIRKKGKDEEWW
jgi:hypothetical protein